MSDFISREMAMSMPPISKEHRDYQTCNLDDAYESGWDWIDDIVAWMPMPEPWKGGKDG